MGLTIQKLNADTTFLLSFGDVNRLTVLTDPWLHGQSSWLHSSFQFSRHTVPPVIDSLAQVAHLVDLIIVSQDKPDHCHRETLCSWPKDKHIQILATPPAAHKIRQWKHFENASIHDLIPYNPFIASTLIKITLPPANEGQPGQLTVANLASKKDLTGLHNAIAITYHPPVNLIRHDSRQESHSDEEEVRPRTAVLVDGPERKTLRSRLRSYRSLRNLRQQHEAPPSLPADPCLSCIYTPHGIPNALLEPYLQAHLIPVQALPVTTLIHSIVMERNPWYMGGIVAAGTPGGIELIKKLGGVRTWISAHDEQKDNRGLSVKLLKSERYNVDQARLLLADAGYDVMVLSPSPGKEIYLPR